MKLKKVCNILIVFSMCILFYGNSYAGNPGTTSFPLLNIPRGAVSSALGGAYSAIGIGAESIEFNPAGISISDTPDLIISHANLYADISQTYFAFIIPSPYRLFFGLYYNKISYGTLGKTTFSSPDGNLGSFEPRTVDVGFTLGGSLTKTIFLGATVKRLRDKISNFTFDCIAYDAGIRYKIPSLNLDLGISSLNNGSGIQYISKKEKLPESTRIGAALNPIESLSISSDYVISKNEKNYYAVGAEFRYNLITVRCGYNSYYDSNSKAKMTYGIGFKGPNKGFTYYIDYSFSSYGDLDYIHKFALTVDFLTFPMLKKELSKIY